MRRVLITGATGFIGCRLAEVVHDRGTPVVALVRTLSRAARLARMAVEIVPGDVLDLGSVQSAMKGCDVVFHCAVDSRRVGRPQRRSIVQGTRNVMQAALEAGVGRVVFLSSIGVFGRVPPLGTLTEEHPCGHTGDNYGDAKIDAERIALRYHRRHGAPVTILRPTLVYGPFSRYWTVDTVATIRAGSMVLVNGGTGLCNCLYVDNLAEAMLLAAQHPRAPGEVFHVSDATPVTWREFIEGHARALGDGVEPLPEMTVAEIETARARARNRQRSSVAQTLQLLRNPHVRNAVRAIPVVSRLEAAGRGFVRTVLPERLQRVLRGVVANTAASPADATDSGAPAASRFPLRSLVRLYASTTIFSIEKAQGILGYRPPVAFAEGMRLTAEWIKWSRL